MINLNTFFSDDNIRYINELRGSPLSPFFYNKGLVLVREFFKTAGKITVPLIILYFLKWLKK